ncbi:hypothetical protein R1sor_004631 [Riccia sorocarpa]|uniref:Uncharacterized protein n=1 Tax=Riccia sorocarpa TaxID=122646 RepID=A0ABD3HLL4_9MARC
MVVSCVTLGMVVSCVVSWGMGVLDIFDLPKIEAIIEEDVRITLETTRPSAHLLAARYEQFDADFGSRAV